MVLGAPLAAAEGAEVSAWPAEPDAVAAGAGSCRQRTMENTECDREEE